MRQTLRLLQQTKVSTLAPKTRDLGAAPDKIIIFRKRSARKAYDAMSMDADIDLLDALADGN